MSCPHVVTTGGRVACLRAGARLGPKPISSYTPPLCHLLFLYHLLAQVTGPGERAGTAGEAIGPRRRPQVHAGASTSTAQPLLSGCISRWVASLGGTPRRSHARLSSSHAPEMPTKPPGNRHHCYPHFLEDRTDLEKLRNSAEAAQLRPRLSLPVAPRHTGAKPASRPGIGPRPPVLPLIFTRLNKSGLSPGRQRQHLLPERGVGLLAASGGGDSGRLWSSEAACLLTPVAKRGFPHTYGVP